MKKPLLTMVPVLASSSLSWPAVKGLTKLVMNRMGVALESPGLLDRDGFTALTSSTTGAELRLTLRAGAETQELQVNAKGSNEAFNKID